MDMRIKFDTIQTLMAPSFFLL